MLKKDNQTNLNNFGIWNKKQFTIPDLKTKRKYKIGFLTSDRIFVMYRQLKKKFRIYDGWGLNKEVIQDLYEKNCKEIRMFVKDGKKLKYILIVKPANWLQKGIPYINEKLNNEFQLILPENCFDFKKVIN